MADESTLGKYAVGVSLDLRDLAGRVGNVETLLGRIEKAVDSLDEKGKKAGFGWLRGAAQLEIARTLVHGFVGAIELVPRVLETSAHWFDETVGAAARYSDTLQNQAALVGTSVRQIEALGAGLEVVSGSSAGAESVLLRLSRAVGAASGGGLRIPPKQAFHELGVELTDTAGRVKPFGDLMDDIGQKLAAMPEGPRRTALAIAIFGGQAGRMLELFRELGSSGKTWQQSLEDLGLTIDTNLLDAAAGLDNQLNILKAQGDTTFRLIGAEAAPAFAPLLQQLIELRKAVIDWVKDNKDGIQDLATIISTKVQQIVQMVQQMAEAFRVSGPTMEDAIVDAFNLMTLSVAKFVTWTGYAISGLAGIAAAKNYIFDSGEVSETTLELYGYGDALIRSGQAAEKAHDDAVKQTAAWRSARDALRLTREEIESLAAASELPQDVQEKVGIDERMQNALGRARTQIEALGDSYLQLNVEQRRFFEQLGLHEKTVPDEKPEEKPAPGTVPPTYNAQQIESATKALQKAIDAADKERAAILGGTQAKVAAIVASQEFAAASDVERQKLRDKLLDLDQLQRAMQRATERLRDFQAQDKQSVVDRDRSFALRKEAIEASLAQAKAQHDEQTILAETAALSAIDAQQRVATEQDAVDRIEQALRDLSDARSREAQITLQAAIANGREIAGVGEEQVANLRTQLAQELTLRREQLDQVRAIAAQQAANAQEAAQREVDRLRGAAVDFKSITGSVLDDMFEGGILGTQKMSKAWESMWLSMGRTGLKTLKDMVLNKVTAFDEPMTLNFTQLPGILAGKFSAVRGFLADIFGDVADDQEAQAADTVARAAAAAQAAASASGGVPYAAPAAADLSSDVASALGQPESPQVPYAPNEAPGPVAAAGTVSSIGKLFSALFGSGAKTGAGLPTSVGTMAVTAGTVVLSAGGSQQPPGAVVPATGPGIPSPTPSPDGEGTGAGGGGGGGPEKKAGGITEALSGLGDIFHNVGTKLLRPLEPLGHLLSTGFAKSANTFAGVGQSLGGALSTIGSFIKGSAGQTLNLIGSIISVVTSIIATVVSLLVTGLTSTATYVATIVATIWGAAAAIIVGGTKVLGTGQTGGYFENGGLTRPPGITEPSNASGAGRLLFFVEPGEGLVNPEATAKLGGRDAIMDLNAGRLPRSLARLAANMPEGVPRISVARMPAPFDGGAASMVNHTTVDNSSVNIGGITVQVPEGTSGEQFGQDLMRGIVRHFGR